MTINDIIKGIPLEHLAEMCEALPIKPNTEFFYIEKGEIRSAILATYEIGHLAVFFWGVGTIRRFTALVFETGETDFRKTVFRTRAEAEAALKGATHE